MYCIITTVPAAIYWARGNASDCSSGFTFYAIQARRS